MLNAYTQQNIMTQIKSIVKCSIVCLYEIIGNCVQYILKRQNEKASLYL